MAFKRKRTYANATSAKRRAVTRRRRNVYGRRLPPRMQGSKRKYYRKKTFARRINMIGETKLLPLRGFNEANPNPIQVGANAYVLQWVMGPTPPAVWSGFQPVSGIQMQRGDTNQQFDGSYVYYKKVHQMIEIDMGRLAEFNDKPPVEFRMIVYKTRRAANPAGVTYDPSTTLFLGLDGTAFGHLTPGVNGTDLMVQPINKRIYSVHKDCKFIMVSPQGPDSSTGYTAAYKCFKRFQLDLPYYKKTKMSDTGSGGLFTPEDLDYRWVVAIYARAMDKDTPADNWEVNMRGVTSFSDV